MKIKIYYGNYFFNLIIVYAIKVGFFPKITGLKSIQQKTVDTANIKKMSSQPVRLCTPYIFWGCWSNSVI